MNATAAQPSATQPFLLQNPFKIVVEYKDEILMERTFQTSPITVGRLTDNDIVLPFDFVSRNHCVIEFKENHWVVTDLGSKLGLSENGKNGLKSLTLPANGSFLINKQVLIKVEIQKNVEFNETFAGAHDVAIDEPVLMTKIGRNSILALDPREHFLGNHGTTLTSQERAVQLVVMWHDQLLETREFGIGETIRWDDGFQFFDFGKTGKDSTDLLVPNGTKYKKVSLKPNMISTVPLQNGILLQFRYVPKSIRPPMHLELFDDKLLHPVLISSLIHGAIGASTLLAPIKPPVAAQEQPERFAKIIMPSKIEVAKVEPTPIPPPLPTPEPTPEKIAEVPTPTPPPEPKIEPKKVVEKKKKAPLKKIVKEKPRASEKAPEPKIAKAPEKKNEPPQAAVQAKVEKATPAPQPFNAKSVGALKTLALLTQKSSVPLANLDTIQVSREVASTSGSVTGHPQQATGDMLKQLNSTSEASTGASNSRGGKISGKYQTGGLSGKAGNRTVKGSIIGGASYADTARTEGLTRDQVMKIVGQHQSQIQQCYERSLVESPDLSGRAQFEWDIDANGVVSKVEVKETTLKGGETLLGCVKSIFAKMKFPKAKNGESTSPSIGLPFGRL